MQNDTVAGYWASLAPSVYVNVPSNFWDTVFAGGIGSVLGALATGGISYWIFTRAETSQNTREDKAHNARLEQDAAASQAQEIRDEELHKRNLEIADKKQKSLEKLKAINIIVELQLILNSMLHRRKTFDLSDINVEQKFDYNNTQWQKLYNSMAEYSDMKNIDTENFEPLFKAEEYILIGKIKILIKNYNKIEIHIDRLNKEIRAFQENVLFKYSKFDDENNTVSATVDEEISTEYKIRSHEFDSSIMVIIQSLDLNIKKAEENLSNATTALHTYFGEDNFLNIAFGIPEFLKGK